MIANHTEARWRQIATVAATFIAVLSIGTAAASVADAKPKDPAVQKSYEDCISNYMNNSKTPVGILELRQFKFDCCIGLGLHWVGGEWNNPNAVCKDDSGNEVFAPRPPVTAPPNATAVLPPGWNQMQ